MIGLFGGLVGILSAIVAIFAIIVFVICVLGLIATFPPAGLALLVWGLVAFNRREGRRQHFSGPVSYAHLPPPPQSRGMAPRRGGRVPNGSPPPPPRTQLSPPPPPPRPDLYATNQWDEDLPTSLD